MKLTIIGAGAMGSALTIPLAVRQHEVRLFGTPFDEAVIASLRNGDPHPALDVNLPDSVRLFGPDSLAEALDSTELILIGVSTKGVLPVVDTLLPFLDEGPPLVTVSKGFLDVDGEAALIGSGIGEYLKRRAVPRPPAVGCLGGPSIAVELAAGTPTAVELAATDEELARRLARGLSSAGFGVRPGDDLRGLETCLAFKNVYAIALAWPAGLAERDGPGGMTNLKAILFLQILQELEKLIEAGGGRPASARRLAGLGDLVTTSEAGRNGRFGKLLGAGKSAEDALGRLKEQGVGTIEGQEATRLGVDYVQSLDGLTLDGLPVLAAINEVVLQGGSVQACLDRLDLSEMTPARIYPVRADPQM